MPFNSGVGEKGTLKNITVESFDIIGTVRSSGLFYSNAGKIYNCTVKDCYISGGYCSDMLGFSNEESGMITNCTVSGGSIHVSYGGFGGYVYSSALVMENYGTLMDSTATSVSMLGTVNHGYVRSAGVAQWNKGIISNCGAVNCSMLAEGHTIWGGERTAGICELNEGNIFNAIPAVVPPKLMVYMKIKELCVKVL